jgi:hypothetical protein
MREAQMQVFFGNYVKKNPPYQSEVYELKLSRGSSLAFDQIKEHQINALLQCENGSFYHKISDPPVFYGQNTRFNVKRPFDCFIVTRVKAFIVVWFYKARQEKYFIKIRIKKFLEMKAATARKSFTEEMALVFGERFLIE